MVKSDFVNVGCEKAKANKVLVEFGALVQNSATDGTIDFDTISTHEFMPYWKHMILYKYLPDDDDFVVVMFGVHVAELHGEDWTGKKISDLGINEKATKEMIRLNKLAMAEKNIIYASGAINFDEDDYRTWHQMKVPLTCKDDANGVMVCMVSNWKDDLGKGT